MNGVEPLAAVSALAAQFAGWLPGQRWFGAKGREISDVAPVAATLLYEGADPDPVRLDHVLLEVGFADSTAKQRYQVLVGYRRQLPERLEHVRIGELPEAGDWRVAFDGLWDGELAGVLLRLMVSGAELGRLRFHMEDGVSVDGGDPPSQALPGLPARVIDAEQSNTSVVYGDTAILKLFRRILPGHNPDLEVARALRGVACQHVPTLYGDITGWVETESTPSTPSTPAARESTASPVSYAMLTGYAVNSADGWAMATASVRDLMAEQDLRADEVGGDFAAESYRLGETVAAVHADLALALGTDTMDSDGLSTMAGRMRARLSSAVVVVPDLGAYQGPLRQAYEALDATATPVPTQRIHGDLHLAQALRTPTGWLLIDFEGEPLLPLAERVRLDSPLKDIAGMFRSYDYAAAHLLVAEEADPQLRFRTHEWINRNRDAFCSGYAAVAGYDPRDENVLLRAYELDKAVYETVYEARNRPHWLPIPLDSIARITS
jgi:maltokinase